MSNHRDTPKGRTSISQEELPHYYQDPGDGLWYPDTPRESWEESLHKMIHEWVVRLIRLGQTKIPEHGFYVFECPELEPYIRNLLSQAITADREALIQRLEKERQQFADFINNGGNWLLPLDQQKYYDGLSRAISLIKEK